MKSKSLIFSTLFLAIVVSIAFLFNSCEKNDGDSKQNAQETKTSNSKILTIFDETNENSISLKVTCDDTSLLSQCSKNDFQLIINPEENEEEFVEEDESDDFIPDVSNPTYSIEVLEKKFKQYVKQYEIIENLPVVDPDTSQLKGLGCGWDTFRFGDCSAICLRTRNESGKLCNDLYFKVYSCSSSTLLNAYWSKKKHGMTWTCNTSGNNGITVYYGRQKKGEFSTKWLH